MIGDGSEGIKSITSMIGKTVIKLVWIFPKLGFFSKLKPVSTYLLAGFHMKNRFSSENVFIKKTFLEIMLRAFLKYIFYAFAVTHCQHYSIITIVFLIFIIA